jgi:uncharacterized protein YhfF
VFGIRGRVVDLVAKLAEEPAQLVEAGVYVADDIEWPVVVAGIVPQALALEDGCLDLLDTAVTGQRTGDPPTVYLCTGALGANGRICRTQGERAFPGLRQVVVDSAGNPVAVIETTAVRVMRLGDVDLDHALGEGEGYASVAEWRAAHERFWHSAEMRQALGDPAFTVGDDTLVVAQEFRLVYD